MERKDKLIVDDLKIKEKIDKEKAIKSEVSALKKLFKELPTNKLKVANNLIEEAAFMKVTLSDLKDQINKDGAIDLFEQGDNAYYRESPAVKAYNTMIQRYTAVCKQLVDIIPTGETKPQQDELLNFIKG